MPVHQDVVHEASHACAATTRAFTPVSRVGWITGAKRGLWLVGSELSVPSFFALSYTSGSWLCGEVRSLVSLVRKRYQLLNGVQDVFTHAPGGQRIILKDKFPNVSDVLCRARVKSKTLLGIHFEERFFSSSSSRWRKLSKNASPSTGFTRPLLMSS